MFEIVTEQKRYLTYTLRDRAANSSITIVPERGGIVTNWRYQEQELLYLDQERFADPNLSIRGGIPILFPICGNLPDNTYTYQGREYQLKQHGFARDLPWQVTAQNRVDCAEITLKLSSNSETLAVYPFEFELDFTYQLQGNTLTIKQEFRNKSPEIMPFSVGLHPYFSINNKEQLSFDIPATEYLDQKTQISHPFTGGFDLSANELDLAFATLSQPSTAINDHQRGLQVKISYSDLYSTLVFWTLLGKDYVCLEPWSAGRNALNTGRKLSYLTPGSSSSASIKFIVKNL